MRSLVTANDLGRAVIELVRNMLAGFQDAEEGDLNYDGAGDGGDASRGVPTELHDAEEGNMNYDGDAGEDVPAEFQDVEAGVIHGGGNGGTGQGVPAAQDAEEAGINHDGACINLRRVAVALLEFSRLLLIYLVLDLFSTASFSLEKLVKLCLSAVFIVVSVVVECLLLQGVVDEARANGIVRATRAMNALVLILVSVWCFFS